MPNCPCGAEKPYQDCCGRYISGQQLPKTPEELMRSRYTAYTEANIDYISETMKPPASNRFDRDSALQFAKRAQWIKLEVVSAYGDEAKGFVEFLAHFSQNQKRHLIHEISEFHFINGQWFYVDGRAPNIPTPIPASKVGRNEPCLCGSGKKYKKCCGSI